MVEELFIVAPSCDLANRQWNIASQNEIYRDMFMIDQQGKGDHETSNKDVKIEKLYSVTARSPRRRNSSRCQSRGWKG